MRTNTNSLGVILNCILALLYIYPLSANADGKGGGDNNYCRNMFSYLMESREGYTLSYLHDGEKSLKNIYDFVSGYDEYLTNCDLPDYALSASYFDLLVAHGRLYVILHNQGGLAAERHAELSIRYSARSLNKPFANTNDVKSFIDSIDRSQRSTFEDQLNK